MKSRGLTILVVYICLVGKYVYVGGMYVISYHFSSDPRSLTKSGGRGACPQDIALIWYARRQIAFGGTELGDLKTIINCLKNISQPLPTQLYTTKIIYPFIDTLWIYATHDYKHPFWLLFARKFSPRHLGAWSPLTRQKRAIRESFLCENPIFHQFTKCSPSKVSAIQ